jgi:hypothetical protein
MTYPQPPGKRQRRRAALIPPSWVALALAVAAVAGVAWLLFQPKTVEVTPESAKVVEAFQSQAAAEDAMPACADVFVPGKAIDEKKALGGCKSTRDQIQYIGNFECNDGRVLFQVDAATGAPNGYGFGGGKYVKVAGETAANRGYAKATAACNG